MDETGFQELFIKYSQSQEGSIEREKCKELLHEHIYLYPIRRYRASSDDASDFYLYLYPKINLLFESYNPNKNISFLVYLSVKLRYYFYKFLEKNKSKKILNIENSHVSWENEADSRPFFVSHENDNDKDKLKSFIQKAIESLEPAEELPTRLYYGFPLRLKHLRFLFKTHGSYLIFDEYREYLNKLNEWEKKESKNKKNLLIKLQKIQLKIETNKEKEDELFKKQKEALDDFFNIKNPISLKKISDILKEAISVIHRKIKKARFKIKNFILNKFEEFKELVNITV
ncbi:MAG: hypothetical protein OEZ22_03845 [Spirochaetia bacterium]|nr:hypothetical protein [Spirochaetia bacterium]